MDEPLVTIVTPSYNQGQFIRATIESVLSQDYPRIEYIIMDGGSRDETAAVVKDYASRLTWISEKDRGQSHAINKGFRMANGAFMSWLNSDDMILPGAVRTAVNGFQRNPQAGAVYGEGYLIDRAGDTIGRFPCTEPFNLWKLVHVSDYILQQTVYFRRDIIEELGYIREDLHYAMDWDILIRIGKRYPLEYIPEYMGCLREHAEAKSSRGGGPRIQEIARVLREHTGLRYPPGYLVYGLETYRRIWCEWIESKTPKAAQALSTKVRQLVHVLSGYCIDRAIHHSQCWYSDGWAGPLVRFMLPAGGARTLTLTGSIPNRGRGQTLSVTAGKKLLGRKSFSAGEFEWALALPAEAGRTPVSLTFRSSSYFVPSRESGSPDSRRLSYLLREVKVEPQAKAVTSGELVRTY